MQTVEDVRHAPRRLAGFSAHVAAENAALKKFLLARLYNNPAIVGDRERSVEALGQLFDFYLEHPEAMPKAYAELAQRSPRYRVVCDYIAGMTDHFLLRQHAELAWDRLGSRVTLAEDRHSAYPVLIVPRSRYSNDRLKPVLLVPVSKHSAGTAQCASLTSLGRDL